MNAEIQRAIAHFGSQSALARALGIHRPAVSQWLAGSTRPKPEHARAIEQLTGGAVQKHELRPDLWDAPRKGRAA